MKKINYWKFVIIIAALIVIFAVRRSCGIVSVVKKATIDTFIKVDIDTFTMPYPVPGKEIRGKIEYRTKRDTSWLDPEKEIFYLPEDISPDITTMLNDYSVKRMYEDTTDGRVLIFDTVQNNKLTGHTVVIKKSDTTIRETVIQYPPKKHLFYFSLAGSKYGAGAGIGLKTPNDYMYNIEIKTDKGLHPEFRLLIPIKFNKK